MKFGKGQYTTLFPPEILCVVIAQLASNKNKSSSDTLNAGSSEYWNGEVFLMRIMEEIDLCLNNLKIPGKFMDFCQFWRVRTSQELL